MYIHTTESSIELVQLYSHAVLMFSFNLMASSQPTNSASRCQMCLLAAHQLPVGEPVINATDTVAYFVSQAPWVDEGCNSS